MNALLIAPILVPLLTAAAALLAWRRRRLQRALGLGGTAVLMCLSVLLLAEVSRAGVQATQIGNWPAPFGITIVADLFSAIMVVLAALIGLAVAIYSLAGIDARRESLGYYAVLHVLLMGVNGAFLTGDLFNLYVWFEVLLIASFVLLTLGGNRAQIEGGIKYVTLSLLSSATFLAAVGILYGIAGTLNMADLGLKLSAPDRSLVTAVAMLFMAAFGIKTAVFPMFFWLPASAERYGIVAVALVVSLLTLFSMTKIWNEVFWKPQPGEANALRLAYPASVPPLPIVPVVLLSLVTLSISIAAEPLFGLAMRASEQLMAPSDYIRAVMGETR